MPRKSVMKLTMQDHPRLSTRNRHILEVRAVRRDGRTTIHFEFSVLEDEKQVGRTVTHILPAVLTPNSPLSCFLADAFGIRLTEGQTVDLASLVGRRIWARFDEGVDEALQAIVSVSPFTGEIVPKPEKKKAPKQKERADGLG